MSSEYRRYNLQSMKSASLLDSTKLRHAKTEPAGGVVAVSSVGVMNSKERKALFLNGYDEMLRRLEPETVLFYGQVPEECTGNIVKIKSFGEELTERKRGK